MRSCRKTHLRARMHAFAAAIALLTCVGSAEAAAPAPKPKFTEPTAFDVSKPFRNLRAPARPLLGTEGQRTIEIRREAHVIPSELDNGYTGEIGRASRRERV